QVADRTADLASVVVLDGGVEATGIGGAPFAQGLLPPRIAASVRDRLARERTGLEHLATALVGTPVAPLGMSEQPHHRCRVDSVGVFGVQLHGAEAERRRP